MPSQEVREAIARQLASLPQVDHNGHPLDPDAEPVVWTNDPDTGQPVRIHHHSAIDPDTGRRTWHRPDPPEAA